MLSDGFFGYFFSAKKVTESLVLYCMQSNSNEAREKKRKLS